jgi:hypothetical protein
MIEAGTSTPKKNMKTKPADNNTRPQIITRARAIRASHKKYRMRMQMPKALHQFATARAQSLGLSLSEYVEVLLHNHIASQASDHSHARQTLPTIAGA